MPGGEQAPGPLVEAGQLPLLGGEGLDHPDAGDGLVDHAGHLGRLLLGVPGRGEDTVPHAGRAGGQGRQHHEGDEGELGLTA